MDTQTGRRRLEYRPWTPQEDAKLRELWLTQSISACSLQMGRGTSSIHNRVQKLGLRRSEEYKAITGCGRFGNRPPWNAGLKGYQAGGRSKETQFKLGDKPSNSWRPIGAERTTRDGTLMRKVADTGIKSADWRPVHVLIWEHHNGPLPAGLIVVFQDRNRENFEPSNLLAVTRAENMRRNSISRYPEEYRRSAITLGWFNRKLRSIENENPI